MRSKVRRKILERLAQTSSISPLPNLIASVAYPSIAIGFDSSRVPIVNHIISLLNTISHLSTNGKYNFTTLKNSNFTFDESEFTSPIKDILIFFKNVFRQLLNNGIAYTKALSSKEIMNKVDNLLRLSELQKFSQINKSGPIGQKIPGDIQQTIRNELLRLRPIR